MIKRPLNPRFSAAVLEGRKVTTIREKPWPVGKPVMLYNWSGAPYRSPQADVAAVVVEDWTPIRIGRVEGELGLMCYLADRGIHRGRLLWSCEGFLSEEDMDEWFRSKMKPGEWVDRALMRFRVVTPAGKFQVANKA